MQNLQNLSLKFIKKDALNRQARRKIEYEERLRNQWRSYHYGALITFLTIIMAILASITPAGNAIIDFTGLTGVKAGQVWLVIAIIAGLLTSFAYGQEKKGL
ncbi:MAG: hypothetical protein ACP5IB_07925 [Thermoplasmata archaeon]